MIVELEYEEESKECEDDSETRAVSCVGDTLWSREREIETERVKQKGGDRQRKKKGERVCIVKKKLGVPFLEDLFSFAQLCNALLSPRSSAGQWCSR